MSDALARERCLYFFFWFAVWPLLVLGSIAFMLWAVAP